MTYGRTAGIPLTCSNDEDYDAGLCYPKCKYGYHGIGPVCWEDCPAGMHTCGALCTRTADVCTENVKEITQSVFNIAFDIAKSVIEGTPIDMADIIKNAG